jgi:hypothetical protein
MFDFVSNDREAILRLNELYLLVNAKKANEKEVENWILAEMHFLTFKLTGYHA